MRAGEAKEHAKAVNTEEAEKMKKKEGDGLGVTIRLGFRIFLRTRLVGIQLCKHVHRGVDPGEENKRMAAKILVEASASSVANDVITATPGESANTAFSPETLQPLQQL